MATSTREVGGATQHVAEFTDLGRAMPDVTIVHSREVGVMSPHGAVTLTEPVFEVLISGKGITDEQLHRVADRFASLAAMAYRAADPAGEAPMVLALQGSRVGREVSAAADVYRRAAESGDRPLLAVMHELHLSKPTASRRIRAAKDAGLLPERARDLR